MERLRARDAVLVVWQDADSALLERFSEEVRNRCEGSLQLERADRLQAAGLDSSSWDAVLVVGSYKEAEGGPPAEVLSEVLRLLKPCGVLIMPPPPTAHSHSLESTLSFLRLSGFVNVILDENHIIAEKPNFEVGSRCSLPRRHVKRDSVSEVAAAWGAGAGEELVDDDKLLDDADLKRPDADSLRVCGSTGQRKACADCSCGLAEELRGAPANTAPKSSCGSCYLGDAFRCSTCPYLGTPAFQPGERVLLADLASDI